MIDTRELIPDRMLRQEGIDVSLSSMGYPGAFETWTLFRSGSKEQLGFLSFHSTATAADSVALRFCRVLPESSDIPARCYALNVSKKGRGVRSFLRQAVRSHSDPYLDPKVVDPAPEIYQDEEEA